MNPELSRRVAKVMNTITRLGGFDLKEKIVDEVMKAKSFDDLKKETKRIIEMAEKVDGIKK